MDNTPALNPAALRKELAELQDQLVADQASCTLLRLPFIQGVGQDAEIADFLLESLKAALADELACPGITVYMPQFGNATEPLAEL